MIMNKKAIILFSGGLDSTTCLAMAKAAGYTCYALTFQYGQRHAVEVTQAMRLANMLKVMEHKILSLPLLEFGNSSLTDQSIAVQDYTGDHKVIPNTYVPARNTIFLSFALAWAEVLNAKDIFIGANDVDYSGYPDCRPVYLQAFENMANLATKVTIDKPLFTIHAPLLRMKKAEIILEGIKLGVEYRETISCYRAGSHGLACGHCDSCVYRKKGFMEAGVQDPTQYI
jgi:7-cyano-7-deazaguanine synthase